MTRTYTKKLLDLIDEGVVDKDTLILNLLNWMSEDFVKEFYEQYYSDLYEEDEDENEEEDLDSQSNCDETAHYRCLE
jgi:hypothetical protein